VFGSVISGVNSQGVPGRTSDGRGVYGEAAGATGANVGVYGESKSDAGKGVYGVGRTGVHGEGKSLSGIGVRGTGIVGVSGDGGSTGVRASGPNYGVYGSSNEVGVRGDGTQYGIYGESGTRAVFGDGGTYGLYGTGDVYGVRGVGGTYGAYLTGTTYGVYANGGTWAAYLVGKAHVTGNLTKGGGGFLVDHPSDPANRTLEHSFVEAPERLNVYRGSVTLTSQGTANVRLPRYYEALNRDHHVQLTPVGAPAPSLHVAQEVANGRFAIAGGGPGQKVYWQVTGARQDAWAQRYPLRVERRKRGQDRGKYLNPEAFGKPRSTAIHAVPREPKLRRPRPPRSLRS
jgi:hypothetical protein